MDRRAVWESEPHYRQWVVPFFGGGADAAEAMRRRTALSFVFGDKCHAGLLAARRWSEVERTLRALLCLPLTVQRATYYAFRASEEVPAEPIVTWQDGAWPPSRETWATLRFLFLLATNFNGVWRVNRAGRYNVPFGRRGSVDWEVLAEFATLLAANAVTWLAGDFEATVALAGVGDLVYADPPYLGTHDYGGFTEADHVRLVTALRAAVARGATCWASGSDCADTRRVYVPRVEHVLTVKRSVAAASESRGNKTELLMEL
jgi:DNA adenine methylase